MEGSGDPKDPREAEIEAALRDFAWLLGEERAPDTEAFLAAHPHVADRLRGRIEGLRGMHGALAGSGPLSPEESPTPSGSGAAEPPPRTLGDFRILREIGRGGMGVVYEAEQIPLRRRVALKVLPAHLTLLPDAVDRFRREASTAARMRHAGIVEVYAVGEEAGTHFFAMEFVEGTPLDKVLERMRAESPECLDGERVGAAVSADAHRSVAAAVEDRGMSGGRRGPSSAWNKTYIETVCRLVSRVADALDHAHKAGVLHRDVKPSNILVREDGFPVVTDFGLAREEGLPSLTRTGEFAGTPYYVSPEQAMARRIPVDHRTDVFSLGVTLYELLTLRRPFEGKSTQEVLAKIVAKEPASPRRWNPLLPRDLVTIVLKAIEKDPDRRYPTAATFATDLRAFLEYRPIVARPASPATRVLKFARRHRVGSGAAAAAVLAAMGAAIAWWLQPGYLTVRSRPPGAAIFVDGVEQPGRTPIESLRVRPGPRRIRLVLAKDGETLGTDEEEVLAPRGRTKDIDRTLASRNGVVRFETDPPGAKVTLLGEGGREVAVPEPTPAMWTAEAGRYRARFTLEGFEPREERLEILPGGALVRCSVRWETGALALESSQDGIQVEIHRGERIAAGPPWRGVALPLESPLTLPVGVYSVRARLAEHDRRDFEGPDSFRVEPGRTTVAPLWVPPLERRFEVSRRESIWSILAADLDGDGATEIVAGLKGGGVLVLRGDGSQRWAAPTNGPPICLAAADLDVDGAMEVLVGTASEQLLALKGDGSVRFDQGPLDGGVLSLLATGDDGRGRPEIVAGTGGGGILRFSPDGSRLGEVRTGESFWWMVAAELDGRAGPEVVAGYESGQILAFSSDGSPVWKAAAGSHVSPLLSADLDGDGRSEVVAGTKGGKVLVLDHDGSVRFERDAGAGTWTVRTGKTIVAVDLDRDRRLEIVAGTMDGRVLAWGADGAPRFEARARGHVHCLLAADLEGEGRAQIVAGTNEGQILVLDPEGRVRFEAAALGAVHFLVAADGDGDGRTEVVAGTSSGRIVALAVPRLQPRFETAAPHPVSSLAVADLDGDGRTEVLAGTESGKILCLGARGLSPFGEPTTGRVQTLVAADLDGREPAEIVAGTESGEIRGFSSDGSTLFRRQAGGDVRALLATDLDGTGARAIIAGTGTGHVLAFTGDGSPLFDWPVVGPVGSVLALDLDGDGRKEVVAGIQAWRGRSGAWEGDVVALSTDGAPVWKATVRGAVLPLAAGDLDGDGKSEIVGGIRYGIYGVFALNRDGSPRFHTGAPGSVLRVVVSDLDRDGRSEIVGGTESGNLRILGGDGVPRAEIALGDEVSALCVADLDVDGRPEVVAGTGGGQLIVLGPDGARIAELRRPAAIARLLAADLDGDGRPELVLSEGRLLAVYPAPEPDPRLVGRRAFLDALAAAERGEEESAAAGFDGALLRWLFWDDSGLGRVRARLMLASQSPSARRMTGILDRVRPPALADWVEVIDAHARAGRVEEAVSMAKRHFESLPSEAALAIPLNQVAWGLVDPKGPVPEAREVALVLAEAAAAADRRRRPFVLDTLAEALHANGRSADAVLAEEEALSKLPADSPARPDYESSLARFRASAAEAVRRSSAGTDSRDGR